MQETVAHIGNLSITRVKNEDTSAQGSLRGKRVGKVTGRYLSGPARRGIKRRQSEEEQSPIPGSGSGLGGALYTTAELDERPKRLEAEQQAIASPPKKQSYQGSQSRGLVGINNQETVGNEQVPLIKENSTHKEQALEKPGSDIETRSRSPPAGSTKVAEKKPKPTQPMFKMPPLPPLISRLDQENEPPPTFKRNKPSSGLAVSEKPQALSILPDRKPLSKTPGTISPPRAALAPLSQNTPMRPPPPPPKMTVLETATAPAGSASASQARKKRNYISVNGKLFTRMDCIGRGGSSKVYRVMAENFKVFALKRVTLDNQDDLAIRGYKGEIDLLKRLENVDRVVRLFDWELNNDRQTLSVLMEIGESDLNRVLTMKINAEDAKLDITFTRYFW